MFKLKNLWKPFSLFFLLALLVVVLYFTGITEYFKWSVWKNIHADIKLYVINNLFKSIFYGIFFYVLVTLSFLPGMILFDLLIGYLFPQIVAVPVIITASAISALIICAGCRFGFKSILINTNSTILQRVQKGVAQNETLYLLFVRFIPVLPFSLVSVAISTLKVSYKKVAWTTFIGMIPVAIIFTNIGRTLENFMQYEKLPPLSDMFTPSVYCSLFLLSILMILPFILKKWKKNISL